MNIEKYYLFFENYTNSFLKNATNTSQTIHLNRKKEHSYRVTDLAFQIGKSLNLNEYDTFLIKIIALFHDLGRFPQFKKYETYDDSISENHALLSIQVIEETNILSNFNNADIEIIKKSILLHNEKALPNNLNEKEFIFSTILRDSDKLDFFKGMVDIIPNLPKEEQKVFYSNKSENNVVSDIVYSKILNRELVSNEELQTKLDKQVRSLGFITSDFNYIESYKIIMNNDYIDKIYELLPKTKQVINIYNFTKSYVLDKLKDLK